MLRSRNGDGFWRRQDSPLSLVVLRRHSSLPQPYEHQLSLTCSDWLQVTWRLRPGISSSPSGLSHFSSYYYSDHNCILLIESHLFRLRRDSTDDIDMGGFGLPGSRRSSAFKSDYCLNEYIDGSGELNLSPSFLWTIYLL